MSPKHRSFPEGGTEVTDPALPPWVQRPSADLAPWLCSAQGLGAAPKGLSLGLRCGVDCPLTVMPLGREAGWPESEDSSLPHQPPAGPVGPQFNGFRISFQMPSPVVWKKLDRASLG